MNERNSLASSGQNLKILVFGTFDRLHKGHLDFFRQAREYGNYLIVVIGRDSSVRKVKNRLPRFNENDRLKKVKESELVNEVLLGSEKHDPYYDPYEIIQEINPDVICLGYDQAEFKDKLQDELQRMNLSNIEIKILKPFKPEVYKSSILNRE